MPCGSRKELPDPIGLRKRSGPIWAYLFYNLRYWRPKLKPFGHFGPLQEVLDPVRVDKTAGPCKIRQDRWM